jgi:hypothetical protein
MHIQHSKHMLLPNYFWINQQTWHGHLVSHFYILNCRPSNICITHSLVKFCSESDITSQPLLIVCHTAVSQSLVHMNVHHSVMSPDTALFGVTIQQYSTAIFLHALDSYAPLLEVIYKYWPWKSHGSSLSKVLSMYLLCTNIIHASRLFTSKTSSHVLVIDE